MKKKLIYILLLIQCWFIASCYKDKGNYEYQDINEISFARFDTVNGYTSNFGATLHITPELIGTKVSPGQSPQYSYEWSIAGQYQNDRILSTEKDLNIEVNELPGAYTLKYRVTDKNTGVLFHIKTTLFVKTEVFEGYMVLSEVNGKSRLDMITYDNLTATFKPIYDVLQKMNSSLPEQGQPYQVVCTKTRSPFNYSDTSYAIYLVTASGTNRIHPETFDSNPMYNIRYEIVGDISPDFKANAIVVDPGFFPAMYLYAENNVHIWTSNAGFYGLPVNRYVGKELFKASPYIAGNGDWTSVTMFDMDKRSFAWLPSHTQTAAVEVPKASQPGDIDYPTGKDLLYMARNASNYLYAITKDPSGNNCYLTKFMSGSLPTYSRLITGTDIHKATHFAISNNPEYLFYSVGGKVYEYDLYLQTSKLMLDKGNAAISYLSFEIFTASDAFPGTYGQWARWLTVGHYDPAGTTGSNGTLEQYQVVDANEPLILKKKWDGFGKIASVSYRERR